MKAFDVRQCRILRREELVPGVFSVWVEAGELAEKAAPGQFAQIAVPGKTLRRPISICEIDKARCALRFVFQIRGEGTEILARYEEGRSWDILAPLGHGFELGDCSRKVCFVGGGIGVPPLLEAAKPFGANASAVLGFRTKAAAILLSDFERQGNRVILATDDGSAGFHGLVTGCMPEDCEAVFACGPTTMLRAVAAWAAERGVPCQISLEQRMACGVGACLGCACKLKAEDGGWRFGHVCKDGPVFRADCVLFE